MVKVVLLGLGSRGVSGYGKYALEFPEKMKISAVCDIDVEKTEKYGDLFQVENEKRYTDSNDLFRSGRLGDAIFICTQDQDHFEQAKKALELGYDILLEKPISSNVKECLALADLAKETGLRVVVCHVLRYTAYFRKIKEIIDEGKIGKLIAINQLENVEYWHQAHSFVRGNWRNSDTTSPMILQKCCHDFDILYWLCGAECEKLSSYGALNWFKYENAPEGSAKRCLEGCKVKNECPFDAEKIYIEGWRRLNLNDEEKKRAFPYNQLCIDPTEESIYKAIQNGPYGRCVYRCDNNVVDHQVVNMLMENGVICTLTMSAFTKTGGRQIKVMGTAGEIIGDEYGNLIRICRFGEREEIIDVRTLTNDISGHSGGDNRLVEDFLNMLEGKKGGICSSTIENSVESHIMAFAAEYSRISGGSNIIVRDFINEIYGEKN